MNFLLLLGIAMFVVTLGARVFQKLHIPQVVGYSVAGLLVGGVGFRLFSEATLDALTPINFFALGIIGLWSAGN